jgi:hypothetical protein
MSQRQTPQSDRIESHNDTPATLRVPREPDAYRVTNHFLNRLKQRVDEAFQPSLPATLIQDGTIRRLKPDCGNNRRECHTKVAFVSTGPKQRAWTLVAGLRHEAYYNQRECHRAITIYCGTPISERIRE